jgi:hypothetical protein
MLERRWEVRKALMVAAVLLAVCAVVVAAEKLSEQARQKIATVKIDLQGRVNKEPLSFHELCWVELNRIEKECVPEEEREEPDPLKYLYALRYSLRSRIRELNPYWQPPREPEKPEKEYKRVYKVYDITDIISLAPNRPAPVAGYGLGSVIEGGTTRSYAGGAIVDLGGESGEAGAGFDWEKIQELMERFLPEELESRTEMRYSAGKLVCYMPEEAVAPVENLLAKLRSCSGYSINIEVKFIRATAAYFRDLARLNGDSPACLTPEAEKKLLDDAAAKKGVEIVSSSEIIAADGQVVHIREGQQLSFLMDYDINTVGIPTLQPVVRIVNEGLICQFQPKVFRDGETIGMDVLAILCKFRKDPRKAEFMGGELTFPTLDVIRVRTDVEVPDGRAVLVGGTAPVSEKDMENRHMYVVYVKPTVDHKNR